MQREFIASNNTTVTCAAHYKRTVRIVSHSTQVELPLTSEYFVLTTVTETVLFTD
jgi:hypothetical protein